MGMTVMTHRACVRSGVKVEELIRKRATLADCRKFLKATKADLASATTAHEVYAVGEAIARVTSAACGLALVLLSPVAGAATTGITMVYSTTQLLIDALEGDLDTQKTLLHGIDQKATAYLTIAGQLGAKRFFQAVGLVKDLAAWGYGFVTDIQSKTVNTGGATGLRGAKATLDRQLDRLDARITALDAKIAACTARSPALP